MSICYYTVSLQPETKPASYICKVYVEVSDVPFLFQSQSFPLLNSQGSMEGHMIAFDAADLYGKLAVNSLMSML